MNVPWYRFRNFFTKVKDRIKHPPPLYKKVGGIDAVVIRANGRRENLKKISYTYTKRWGVGAGSGPAPVPETDERPDA